MSLDFLTTMFYFLTITTSLTTFSHYKILTTNLYFLIITIILTTFSHHTSRCSDGHNFGVEASEIWSKCMQWADAESSFNKGYAKMQRKYQNQPARLEYIKELFQDPKKTLFKIKWSFTNAVVVDVCECLFFALKNWTSGNTGRPVSLLMAVARIVEGTRRMMLKPFLYQYEINFMKRTVVHQPPVVKFVFQQIMKHLTKRSTETMFAALTSCWSDYEVQIMDECTSVISRYSQDEFVVDNDFDCWCNHKRCWIQIYTGLVCKHGLLAAVEKIRNCEEDKDKQDIITAVINVCHPNWLKKTYSSKRLRDVPIPCEPPSVYDVPSRIVTDEKQVWMNRFQEVIKYLPPGFVEETLEVMERTALDESDDEHEVVILDESDDEDEVTDGDDQTNTEPEDEADPPPRMYYESMVESASTTQRIRNPPKRKQTSKNTQRRSRSRVHVMSDI